ncbi:MAG: class I SAM-dependent methyltransferase [Fusobacteriaceae bacterium]
MNVDYYNKKSKEFFNDTVSADMSVQYKIFEEYLALGNIILDLGCGSGRDSKYFLKLKYQVIATDIAKELVKKATNYIGQEVLLLDMREMNFENKFNGIWACASILHIKKSEIDMLHLSMERLTMKKMADIFLVLQRKVLKKLFL